MRRMMRILVMAVVVVFGLMYYVYYSDYRGNYNADVTFLATQNSEGVFSATQIDITSEKTSITQAWPFSTDTSGGLYKAYAEFTSSATNLAKTGMAAFSLADGSSETVTIHVDNIAPGEYTVRLYIVYEFTQTIVFDHSYTEVVG